MMFRQILKSFLLLSLSSWPMAFADPTAGSPDAVWYHNKLADLQGANASLDGVVSCVDGHEVGDVPHECISKNINAAVASLSNGATWQYKRQLQPLIEKLKSKVKICSTLSGGINAECITTVVGDAKSIINPVMTDINSHLGTLKSADPYAQLADLRSKYAALNAKYGKLHNNYLAAIARAKNCGNTGSQSVSLPNASSSKVGPSTGSPEQDAPVPFVADPAAQ